MGVARVDKLTSDQIARFGEWADRWIEIGVRTGPADRERFESAVRDCYRFANIPFPDVVVWVPSPLVLAFAAPAAALAIELLEGGRSGGRRAVRDAVDVAVGGAVHGAVDGAVRVAVRDAVRVAVHGAVHGAVHVAVDGAVGGAVRDAVRVAVDDAVGGAVDDAVGGAVDDAVHGAVHDAVHVAVAGAVVGAVHGAVRDAVRVAVHGAVHVAVHGAVDGAVGGAVRDAVRVAVDDAVRVAVDDAVGGAVDDAVDDAVGGAVRDAVHVAVDDAVRVAVDDAVHGAVDDAVHGAVHDAVRDAVDDAVHGAVHGAVRDAVRDAVDDAVDDAVARGWYRFMGGQMWVGGWYWGGAVPSFFRDVCGLDLPGDIWDRARAYEATMESACWWWPHRRFVMVSERPLAIHRELTDPSVERGWGSHRLHNDEGPAVVWPDGWGVWAVHGVRVTQQVVEHPETLTANEILNEQNVEVRRVMVDRFGYDRLLRDTDAALVGQDDFGKLWRIPMADDEDIHLVEVVNSTAELDGSFRDYILRVPPSVGSPREAVAWTFAVPPSEYELAVEA